MSRCIVVIYLAEELFSQYPRKMIEMEIAKRYPFISVRFGVCEHGWSMDVSGNSPRKHIMLANAKEVMEEIIQ
jgi:hypothetical protein